MEKSELAKTLKHRLYEGPVRFSYSKKNGEVRNAYGTMKADALPIQIPLVKFKCKNINWDTNGRGQCSLPKKVTIEIDEAYVNELGHDKIEDELANELSEKYGFSVLEYEYERIEKRTPKKLPEGTVFYYDIDKAGYRSFNESQLICVEL